MKRKICIAALSIVLTLLLAAGLTACGGASFSLAKTEYTLGSYAEADIELTSGNVADLTFTSSDESVVKIENGRLIAQGKDAEDKSATVTVSAGKKSETVTVRVVNEGRPQLTLAKTSVTLYDNGQSETIVPTVKYQDAAVSAQPAFKLTVAEPAVASASGLTLTGVAEGTTTAVVEATYKGAELSQTVSVTVNPSTSVAFEQDEINIYRTEQEKFNSAELSVTVYDNMQLVSDPDVTYSVVSGGEFITLEGNKVTAKAEGTAVVKALYKTYEAEIDVNVLPNSTEAKLYTRSAYSSTVTLYERPADSKFDEPYYQYVNTRTDNESESGVYFEKLTGGDVPETYYNNWFFNNGFTVIKTQMYLETDVTGIILRFQDTAWLEAFRDRSGNANANMQYISVGQSIAYNGDIHYFVGEDGKLANTLETQKWYTVYIPISMDTSLIGTHGIVAGISVMRNGNSNPQSTVYYKNVEFYKDMPDEVLALANYMESKGDVTVYESDTAALNTKPLGVTVYENNIAVSNPIVEYSVVSGGEYVTLNSDGTVTAKKAGTAKIKAVYGDMDCEITVIVAALTKTVAFTESTITKKDIDADFTLAAKYYENSTEISDAQIVYTITSGENVIELNGAIVHILASGEAVITASCNGATADVTISVTSTHESTTIRLVGAAATLELQEEGEFAGAYKYTGSEYNEAQQWASTTLMDAQSVTFDGLTQNANGSNLSQSFIDGGFKYLKFEVYFTSTARGFNLRFSGTQFSQDVATLWSGSLNSVCRDMSNKTFSGNGTSYYIIDNETGTLASEYAQNKWFTFYIPIEGVTDENSFYALFTAYYGNYTSAAVMYLQNAEFWTELPPDVAALTVTDDNA